MRKKKTEVVEKRNEEQYFTDAQRDMIPQILLEAVKTPKSAQQYMLGYARGVNDAERLFT